MSYDLTLWCVNEPDIYRAVPDRTKWRQEGDLDLLTTKNWELAYCAARVEIEDVPEAVMAALPGVSWMAQLTLSPITSKAGQTLVKRIAKALSRDAYGVIEDAQTETIVLPSGVKRFVLPEPRELVDVLQMSWWTDTGALRDPDTLDRLIDVMSEVLPDALPRRYGDVEPPKFKLAEMGEAHFREAFRKTPNDKFGLFVMYPTRPVGNVWLSNNNAPGPCWAGYRANYFTVEVEAEALRQPGWQKQLRAFWERVSVIVKPFYGDVRVLSAHEMSRGKLSTGPKTENHPVVNWWWKGLPNSSTLAIVLGEPYRSMWNIKGPVTNQGALVFATVEDWGAGTRLSSLIGDPPPEIAHGYKPGLVIPGLGSLGPEPDYAPVFPFQASSSK